MRGALASPRVYSFFRSLVSAPRHQRIYVEEYVRARPGDRILDIGCGPADVLQFLPPSVDYEGFDLSEAYIRRAQQRWGGRGRFYNRRVDDASVRQEEPFDVVLANGVLHHLDDREAAALFRLAHAALKPGGRLVTLDGVYVPGQSRLARYLLSKDRGTFVRDEQAYLTLARKVFTSVTPHVRHDLLRVSYTLLIMECVRTA